MAAVLIAVVLALVLGHGVPALTRLRHFGWFDGWLGLLGRPAWLAALFGSRWGILLSIGIPVALVALLQIALRGYAFGLPSFAFSLVTLFYCWGPRDLDRDVAAVLDADDRSQRLVAVANLTPANLTPRLSGAALVETAFMAALSRWFGVLLWFLLLGPFGALLYRLGKRAANSQKEAPLPYMHAASVTRLEAILDWPAAQLMVFSLGLVANLDAVLAAWRGWYREKGHGYLALDNGYLAPVARAGVNAELIEDDAYDPDDGSEPPPLLELQDAMSLLWRMLLLWLTVLALFVLAGVVN